jgi:hypothetical protein
MKIIRTITSLILLCVFSTSSALAHHSHSTIDRNDVRVLRGIVTTYGWSMPHVYLKVNAPNLQGEIVEFSIEMNHPAAMSERGWTKDSFKTGDVVTWEGAHHRNKARAYSSMSWVEKDGVRVGNSEQDQIPILPSTDLTGLWDRAPNQPTYSPPGHPGNFLSEAWPLTEMGEALIANFNEDQNPVLTCGDPGPPKSMTLPYSHQISRVDENTLIIGRDLMEGQRVVHLDGRPASSPPSKLGHSIGWFEGADLIVETSNFTADVWGAHTGIDSSDQKHIIERFNLSDDGLGIELTITLTDPVYLAQPVTFTHQWIKTFDRELVQTPCTMESAQLWIEAGYN